MSNTWKRAAVALRLGLSGLILFVSAACAATVTPAPPNTPGTEATVRAGSKASGTAMPTPTHVLNAPGTIAKWRREVYKDIGSEIRECADMEAAESLFGCLELVPDPRRARGVRHPFQAILRLTLLGLVCGQTTMAHIALFARIHWPVLREPLGFVRDPRHHHLPCSGRSLL